MIQRNLPITDTYKIIGSYYAGLENGVCCDNCGRIIANIANLQNSTGKQYTVGMDCAATLSGIKGNFYFEYIHKANFNTAKQARAQILKLQKQGCINLRFAPTKDGLQNSWHVDTQRNGQFAGGVWKYYPIEVWNNYVQPMIKDLV